MSLEVIDGQVVQVDQAVAQVEQVRAALLTLPFLGGRKLVHFKNVTFLGDTKEGRSEAVLAALDRLLETVKNCPPHQAQLLISALGLDRRRSFAKQIEALAHVERYDLIDLRAKGGDAAVAAEIEQMLRSLGLTAEPAAVERLMLLVGNETRTLHNELEKLALYLHPETVVTEAAVREIVAATRELAVWDLCDAVAEGKTQEAVGQLRQLLAQGENEIGILAVLSNNFRLMAVCRALEESGDLKVTSGRFPSVTMTDEAKVLLPKTKAGELPKPFRLGRLTAQAKLRSRESVFRTLETLYRTYWAALSGGTERVRALEAGIVDMCRLV